jgi:hypothetical protein
MVRPDRLAAACARGSSAHTASLGLAAGNFTFVPPEVQGYYDSFRLWFDKMVDTVIEVEPLDPIAGHIPGAQCAVFTDNLGNDGRFLAPTALRERFDKLRGERPLENLVAYCGSGVTACHNLFAMSLAGYPLAPLYAGSWSEWITDPTRPVATGD